MTAETGSDGLVVCFTQCTGRGPKPGLSLPVAWEGLEEGTHLKLLGTALAIPRNPRQQLENYHTIDED